MEIQYTITAKLNGETFYLGNNCLNKFVMNKKSSKNKILFTRDTAELNKIFNNLSTKSLLLIHWNIIEIIM